MNYKETFKFGTFGITRQRTVGGTHLSGMLTVEASLEYLLPSSEPSLGQATAVIWIAGCPPAQFISSPFSRINVLKQVLVMSLLCVHPLSGLYCPKDKVHISYGTSVL